MCIYKKFLFATCCKLLVFNVMCSNDLSSQVHKDIAHQYHGPVNSMAPVNVAQVNITSMPMLEVVNDDNKEVEEVIKTLKEIDKSTELMQIMIDCYTMCCLQIYNDQDRLNSLGFGTFYDMVNLEKASHMSGDLQVSSFDKYILITNKIIPSINYTKLVTNESVEYYKKDKLNNVDLKVPPELDRQMWKLRNKLSGMYSYSLNMSKQYNNKVVIAGRIALSLASVILLCFIGSGDAYECATQVINGIVNFLSVQNSKRPVFSLCTELNKFCTFGGRIFGEISQCVQQRLNVFIFGQFYKRQINDDIEANKQTLGRSKSLVNIYNKDASNLNNVEYGQFSNMNLVVNSWRESIDVENYVRSDKAGVVRIFDLFGDIKKRANTEVFDIIETSVRNLFLQKPIDEKMPFYTFLHNLFSHIVSVCYTEYKMSQEGVNMILNEFFQEANKYINDESKHKGGRSVLGRMNNINDAFKNKWTNFIPLMLHQIIAIPQIVSNLFLLIQATVLSATVAKTIQDNSENGVLFNRITQLVSVVSVVSNAMSLGANKLQDIAVELLKKNMCKMIMAQVFFFSTEFSYTVKTANDTESFGETLSMESLEIPNERASINLFARLKNCFMKEKNVESDASKSVACDVESGQNSKKKCGEIDIGKSKLQNLNGSAVVQGPRFQDGLKNVDKIDLLLHLKGSSNVQSVETSDSVVKPVDRGIKLTNTTVETTDIETTDIEI